MTRLGIPAADISHQLDAQGVALIPRMLSPGECLKLTKLYAGSRGRFRSTITMQRHNFGSGEYKYFDYPLPPLVNQLREQLYVPLAAVANSWSERLKLAYTWPKTLPLFLEQCHGAGQKRPTPLLLKYVVGDYNCLHQDLYGEVYFPLQVIVMLTQPATDFKGGELVLVEQRPRMQSRPMVLQPNQGDAVVIPVRSRAAVGKRGYHQVQARHGVSQVLQGVRMTLGIIFHDGT